jgi:putative serine protease PepD
VVTGQRRGTTSLIVVVLIIVGIAGGAIAAEIVLSKGAAAPILTGSPASSVSTSAASGQAALSPAAIYRQAAPGVVTINTQSGQSRRPSAGTGSGIVLNRNGEILTNAHVISGADQIQVTFEDGTTVPASVVNTNTNADLAVIRVQVSSSSLHPLTLGNSDAVLVGDSVYAIGAPFGHPESMSSGIVSGLNRTDQTTGLQGLIQTDARINPGNSGGPLLNTLGQVIGINVAIDSPVAGSVGVGFAIPVKAVRQVSGSGL